MYRLSSLSALVLALLTIVSAYRPVQFVKHTGESGRADQAFSLVNYYNETTQQSDLYVRMWAFRYASSAKGWASLALGPQMKGALMFITYGDPASNTLTLSVRTVDGHHPPRPIPEMKDFYSGEVPIVDVVSTRFEEYTGQFYHEKLQAKPSHLGIAEFVVRGYDKWTACELGVHNDTTKQSMIWSSNFKQDFGGDFSAERGIDMHQFGLGFGFLWADIKNALSPVPFFGPINDMESHKGVNEIGDPLVPTTEELDNGENIVSQQKDATSGSGEDKSTTDADKDTSTGTGTDKVGADNGTNVEEPVKTVKQFNIRSLMWHIHGFLMTLSFLVLYPLGVYFLRSPRATAFNLHWTINSLSSVSVSIGALIGFVNSRSISIWHQYLGILIICGLAVQTVLGWRHHVVYVSPHGGRRTWMSAVHVWLGRIVLPVAMLNLISGLLLRQFGWLTISLTIALAAVELILLTLMVGRARTRRPAAPQKTAPIGADEAEEYFQLGGDDDDDEFSDDEAEGAAGNKNAEREEQAKRLAKLDKV